MTVRPVKSGRELAESVLESIEAGITRTLSRMQEAADYYDVKRSDDGIHIKGRFK